MSMRLVLMRHAKSSWDHPGLSDHNRPLNTRGRDAAKRIGDWLRAQGIVPDEILCSSAVRTMETCERLGFAQDFKPNRALYHAYPDAIWSELAQATGRTVLLLGHNPGIAAFASEMMAEPVAHPRFFDFPTAATLIADFDVPGWSKAAPGQGRLVSFIVPRDLG